ncbi:MAG: MBL fold metallo-hydrolase [Dehalococcoidia bacterium]|nr:MBL fold metallo-hydrolase [Dehalococcoidia bacterium]
MTPSGSSGSAHSQYRVVAGGAPATSLRWLGHSCVLLTTSSGAGILMDPIPQGYGYEGPALEGVDAVTVTHEHPDHTNVGLAAGSPLVLRGISGGDWATIDQKVKDVHVRAVGTCHDEVGGTKRGKNASFVFEADGMRIAHLGDLEHVLSAQQAAALGPVDVLLIPVGGFYTIDSAQAAQVAEQLKARVVIPIHFKTSRLRPDWPGVGVDAFLTGKEIQRSSGSVYTFTKETLPASPVVVLLNPE